jgi:hypothetical protein
MHYIRHLLALFALAIQVSTSAATQGIPIAQLDPNHYLDKQQGCSVWLSFICLCVSGFVVIYYLNDLLVRFYILFFESGGEPPTGKKQRRIRAWYRDDRPSFQQVRGSDPFAGFRRNRQPIRSQTKAGRGLKCPVY